MEKKNQSEKHQQSLLDALISDVVSEIPLEDIVRFANLAEDEVEVLKAVLARFLSYRIEKLDEPVNDELLEECRERSGDNSLDDAGVSSLILTELWKLLRDTHRVRVVK
jgi:hypothetical protein